MIIPMDTTSTIQAPSGPMTRARARAIQSEVTSLLLEFPSSSSETWLLPKSKMLCVIRYNAQATEPRAKEEVTGVNSLDSLEIPARAWNFRPPDLPADPELPASYDINQPGRVYSLGTPEPARNLARYFRPCLRAVTWAEARVPFRPRDYIYSSPTYILGLAE